MSYETNPKKNPAARRKRPTITYESQDGTMYQRLDGSIVHRTPYVNKRALRNKYREIAE